MSFDIKVAHDADGTRVVITGKPTLGQLSSLLQVLELDSAGWPRGEVVLDLRELAVRFSPAERALLQQIARCRLGRVGRVGLRWAGA